MSGFDPDQLQQATRMLSAQEEAMRVAQHPEEAERRRLPIANRLDVLILGGLAMVGLIVVLVLLFVV